MRMSYPHLEIGWCRHTVNQLNQFGKFWDTRCYLGLRYNWMSTLSTWTGVFEPFKKKINKLKYTVSHSSYSVAVQVQAHCMYSEYFISNDSVINHCFQLFMFNFIKFMFIIGLCSYKSQKKTVMIQNDFQNTNGRNSAMKTWG